MSRSLSSWTQLRVTPPPSPEPVWSSASQGSTEKRFQFPLNSYILLESPVWALWGFRVPQGFFTKLEPCLKLCCRGVYRTFMSSPKWPNTTPVSVKGSLAFCRGSMWNLLWWRNAQLQGSVEKQGMSEEPFVSNVCNAQYFGTLASMHKNATDCSLFRNSFGFSENP